MLTFSVQNLGFCVVADLRDESVPDTGPESTILTVVAGDESSAVEAIRQAILGNFPSGPVPQPQFNFVNSDVLKSLTLEDFDKAKRDLKLYADE